jgi:putative spermidine/putrescine transport system substrate-binding protein
MSDRRLNRLNRRTFLAGASALTLGQGVTGCSPRPSAALQVGLLARSLPPQLVSQFKRQIETEAELKLFLKSSPAELFASLQQLLDKSGPPERQSWLQALTSFLFGPPPKNTYPIISLGDYWLPAAITQNLIRPWSVEQLKGWATLPPQYQRLVRRNRQGLPTSQGELWGAPYRWGATLIAFRKDKFRELGWTPTDWADLWRPELKQKISVLAQPREVIGLTLKKLGYSYNSANLGSVPELLPELQRLHRQVKFYSSTDYLQPLLLEDTWVAVGWSSDILPLVTEEPDLGLIAPRAGTALWSDLWVQPALEPLDPLKPYGGKPVQQWAEFWWQPQVAQALSEFSDGLSPLLPSLTLPKKLSLRLNPKEPWFNRSEFLAPLPSATLKQYETLWQQMQA